jgi:hypothetical protein
MTLATEPQYVKAELRIRFGSVAAFERAKGLPEKSVNDLLRGRPSARVRQAIDDALSKPLISANESELSDSSQKESASHRLNAGAR